MEGSSTFVISNEYIPTFVDRQFNAWLNQDETSFNVIIGGKLNSRFIYRRTAEGALFRNRVYCRPASYAKS